VPGRDLVVVGGSAGCVEPMRAMFADLPADLPATVLVVAHVPPRGQSALARILDRAGAMPVSDARAGASLEPGHAYVAVPDKHLLVHAGSIMLSSAPRQNAVRPSVDALFRSAARWHGAQTIGVLMSGVLDDGAAGLAAIDELGGVGVVQDPADAVFPGMPESALAVLEHAIVRPGSLLGATVAELAGRPIEEPARTIHEDLIKETEMTANSAAVRPEQIGEPVALGCPECGGGLSVVAAGATGTAEYFRCHVGHIYSPLNLLAAQRDEIEAGLWTAVSMLEEQATVHQRLAERANANSAPITMRHQRATATELLRAAEIIRKHFPDIARTPR
jgi:two-component system chemotaxis response regulator CheB